MFDNLRDDSNTFNDSVEAKYTPAGGGFISSSSSKRFLGMTSMQRFVIAFLMMLTVCVLGVMVLLVFGKLGI